MATSTISGRLRNGSGTPYQGVTVVAKLRRGFFTIDTDDAVVGNVTTTTDAGGQFQLPLERQSNITPDNSYWEVSAELPGADGGPNQWTISVGPTNATLLASLITPAPVNSSTYLTQASADARYLPVDAATGTPGNYVYDGVVYPTLQAFLTALPDNSVGIVPPGVYSSGNLNFADKTDVTLWGFGATINWTGGAGGLDGLGIRFTGEHTNVAVLGFTFNGDGVVANKHSGLWCNSGTIINTIRVAYNRFTNLFQGVTLGTAVEGDMSDFDITANYFDNIVGVLSGQGYAVNTENVTGWRVTKNFISRTQRHAIYYGGGDGATIDGNIIENHRQGIASAGGSRSAIVASRCTNVAINANIVLAPNDTAIEVSADFVAGEDCAGVTVTANVVSRQFAHPAPLIAIGDTSLTPRDTGLVVIANNTLTMDNESTIGATPIQVYSGTAIDILGNNMRMMNTPAAGQVGFIQIQAIGETPGLATYTNNIMVKGNHGTASGASARGVFLFDTFATSACRADFSGNRWLLPGSTVFGSTTTVTNPNIYVSNEPTTGLPIGIAREENRVRVVATIDFPSLAAGTTNDQLVADPKLNGIGTAPTILVTPDLNIPAGLMVMGVPAAGGNGVYVRMANVTAGAIDPPSLSFTIDACLAR